MILEAFSQAGPWTWITAGIALLGLELLAPGTFFMWLGLAAIGVGAIAFFVDFSWQGQLVLFGVLALVLVVAGRRFFARRGDETTDTPGLNERGKTHIGKELTLAEPLVNGNGRVKIGDTLWRVEGADMPAGARVRVHDVRSATLLVEALD
ncbi:MAG: NfeD family protein [Devosiaceae bacterium]